MKILFVSRWFPYPADNGSKIRIFNLIKQLSRHHEIYLVSFTSAEPEDSILRFLYHFCRQVRFVAYHSFHPTRLKALAAFLSRRPRSVVDTHSADMQCLVESVAQAYSPDLVIASQIDVGLYAAGLSCDKKILEEMELSLPYEAYQQETQTLARIRKGLTWWKQARYIAELVRHFDGCTVVSALEEQRLEQVSSNSTPICLIPNGIDINNLTGNFGSPIANNLIYSGALTYHANFDAMRYFLHEIFPLIRSHNPEVQLVITGNYDDVPVSQLPLDNCVRLTGYLPDVRPQIANSWLSIVPLRVGGGTRLKILESLALGTPVVTTSKGIEGLDIEPGQGIMIADEPRSFADAVLQVSGNPDLRATLSESGKQIVAKYDWSIIGAKFCDFVEMITGQRHA